MKLLRKAVTFRSYLNKLLRKPKRVLIEKTGTGLIIETQVFNNKQIIKVY
jgi:hypothetical protein